MLTKPTGNANVQFRRTRFVAKAVVVRSATRRSFLFSIIMGCAGIGLSGCGYMVGNGFSPDIKTVSVPIFENDTFRRGIEVQLTEAVQREIQQRTPYRLAKGLNADTRLTGRIVQTRKDVLGENKFDDPRELQVSLMIVAKWENLRTGEVLAQQEVPLSPAAIPLSTQVEFAPEVGQSLATGTKDSVDQMARRIVNMMEVPW